VEGAETNNVPRYTGTMTTEAWDAMFSRMRDAVVKAGGDLPSVSAIAKEKRDPYRVLISTLLSLRTKDQVTLEASRRLFAMADNPYDMAHLSVKEIEKAIFPSGFYQRKAQEILDISHILLDSYGGEVPSDQKALLSLPGVGIKTANLTLNLGFGIEALCVDCHVHQISNRMGWVRTKTPEETEKALQTIMPKKHWIPMNELLVSFGQLVCTSVSPKCSICPESSHCPKIGVTKTR